MLRDLILIGALLVVAFVIGVVLVVTFPPDWIEHHSNGRIKSRGPVRGADFADKQDHWTFWHEDGWKEREGNYDGGDESGIWTFFHPSGRVAARGQLDGWHRVGTWKFWDDSGQPVSESEFLANHDRLELPKS